MLTRRKENFIEAHNLAASSVSASGFFGIGIALGVLTAILSINFNIIVLLGVALWLLIWALLLALVVRIGKTLESYRLRNDVYKAIVWTLAGSVVGFFGTFLAFQSFLLVLIILGTCGAGYRILQSRRDWSQMSPEMQRFLRTFLRWLLPAAAFLSAFLIITIDLLRIDNPWIILMGTIIYLIPSTIGTVKSFRSLLGSKKE